MEVSTERPPAHGGRRGTVAEVQNDGVDRLERSSEVSGGLAGDEPVRGAVEAVAADAELLSPLPRHGVGVGVLGERLVECGVEDRHLRHAREQPAGHRETLEVGRVVQWGQRRPAPRSPRPGRRRPAQAAENRSPPCTTRCPTAASSAASSGGPWASKASSAARSAASWDGRGRSRRCFSPSAPRWVRIPVLAEESAIRSATPEPWVCPLSPSTRLYFSDEDPALMTSTSAVTCRLGGSGRRLLGSSGQLGLDRGDGDGVDDVADRGASGEVVDRLAQPLQHRADRDRAGRALHRLVGVVAGVEVGEDEDGGPPGDGGVRQLGPGHGGVDRGVVLDGPLDQQLGRAVADQRRGRRDLLHVAARSGAAGRVGQHRHPRLDAERRRGGRRGDGDVSELLGGRVGVDRAVAVDEHLVLAGT